MNKCVKSLVVLIIILAPSTAVAQTPDDAAMQNYFLEMQNCMAQVDQAALDALGQRSDAVDAEIALL